VLLREKLAEMYVEDGRYEDAIAQYDAILGIAQTEATRGQITYQAGSVELLAGNSDLGYERYLVGVNEFPQAYESYQALIALIEAGYEVDQFQRGLVDFHAKAYEPAIEAFNLFIEANPVHREDVHLFLAWSHEGVGDFSAALGQIDAYIEANTPADNGTDAEETAPDNEITDEDSEDEVLAQNNAVVATGWIERAKLQRRAGLTEDATASYLSYLELFPEEKDAPLAAWWAAALTERSGDIEGAVSLYGQLASSYPNHEDAAEALFRAGYLSWLLDDGDAAEDFWLLAVDMYPHREYGAAAWNWLNKTVSDGEIVPIHDEAGIRLGEGYYSLRAQDIASETDPFEPAGGIELDLAKQDQEMADAWLRQMLGLEPDVDVRSLSDTLAEDSRLIRGRKLWNLGFRAQAKRELESLRNEISDDALASYQLALFFRDLGLFRSSILAATSVMRNFEATVFEAPPFIGRLAYPVYYADLIVAESETYEYDQLLQFALVRQESLFESFATSSAVAQGLSQVIPDTGAYIAQRLGWQDYVNEDLYRPYVGIAFGAFYLDQQLEGFDGNIAAALSAYNAGPGNAARWYGQAPDDIDQFIEIIDFAETRQYVERIFSGHAIYRHLYSDD
jgi:soluble lytic murein transglycosylase